ncbi:MAG: FAD-dependent oxidoreductase, partial [Clostridiales bacterium]|nr:FAD-dependent oxidoreductase [Clostridiales bacterium]
DTYRIKEFIQARKPENAVIIGSGYIGVEMAENLQHAGLKVAMIEAQNHVIGSLDAEMAAIVHNEIRNNGVGLYLESKVTAIEADGIILEDGRKVPADLVIMSIGVQPETGFIKDSGISLGERGELLVDECLRTNIPDVYALGDAVSTLNIVSGKKLVIPLASPANKQARIVADVICGKKASYKGTQGTAIARVFGVTAAVTGESEASLKRNGIEYFKSYTFSNSNAGYYPGGATMAVKLMYDGKGRLLGSPIIGPKGVDKRMDVLATAVRAGLTVYDLQELELAYAPPFSSAKDPVNMAGYVAANILEGTSKPFYIEDLDKIGVDDILLDVRTVGEFDAGHLPGALNIPVDELRERLGELDRNKKIYIYCGIGLRGYVAQRIFEQKGYDTLNMSGGYTLWKAVDNDRKAQAAAFESCSHCGKTI